MIGAPKQTGRPPMSARVTRDVEARIRASVLAGARLAEIGRTTGFTEEEVYLYVRGRKARWISEDQARRRAEARGHTVVFKPFLRKGGGYDIRPITLPGVTMHKAALAEARSHAG